MIEVIYHGGIHLPELDLWLDPHGSRPRAFVSHAHFDHFAKHGNMLCSPVTAGLVRARFRIAEKRILSQRFGEVRQERGFEIRLLPAGHISGSAMIHLTRLRDGASLLYTGDFKVRHGLTAEPAEFLPADTLIMETTFGLPHYVFPPEVEIHEAIIRFVKSAFDCSEVPVLLGYSLGKAQEIIALLDRYCIPCLQHPTVAAMSDACVSLGVSLPQTQPFSKDVPRGHALVCPPSAVRSQALRHIKTRRVAMLTGWAMNASAHYRYLTDTAFPLSDHADFPGLLEAVERVNPTRVLTIHGSTREFAATLRSRGIDAWSIFGDDQLELSIQSLPSDACQRAHHRPPCPLHDFTSLCESTERATGRLEKIRLIADYLARLAPDELPLAARWLSGRALPRTSGHRSLQVGTALIRQSLVEATGLPLSRYRSISASQNDLARTTRLFLEEAASTPEPMNLQDLQSRLYQLATASGSMVRIDLLAGIIRALHPAEAASVVRIITGGLRIGSQDGLLEEAITGAFGCDADSVRRAHMLTGDLGEVALLARQDTLGEAQLRPLVPVLPMLASPETDAASIRKRLADHPAVWLEPKYDGIRAQIHKSGNEVDLFSRDLRSLAAEFSELVDEASVLPDDFILDGEIIAFAEGRKLTFFDLQKRLGRKKDQGDLFLGAAIPVKFVAFDALYANGRSLLDEPLHARRKELETLRLSPAMESIGVTHARDVAAIEAAFKRARLAGTEGLIAKSPDSSYSPGRRGKTWLKLKHTMPTLDCVVIKAQQGHGRRAEVLSDYTFALRDESTGKLVTLGKAYSGLTDIEIEQLTEHFKKHTVSVTRRVHTVEPNIVLEIAFDQIRRSTRHDSGLALRFPRIKAIRRDKGLEDIDTVRDARLLMDQP